MKSLHHSNIVAFEHYFEDSENVYLLIEICQNQTLNELLKRRKKLTELIDKVLDTTGLREDLKIKIIIRISCLMKARATKKLKKRKNDTLKN